MTQKHAPAPTPPQGLKRILGRFEAWVLVGLILAAGALWAFLNIAGEMADGETSAIDQRLLMLLRVPGDANNPIGSKGIEESIRDVTALGGTTLVTLVTVVAVVTFLFHKKRRHAMVMAASVLLALLSSEATKSLYHRPRPALVPHEVYVYSGSFPSGHSTLSAATYLTLAMLVASLETRRRTKALAYGLAATMLVAVGFSRVYLGVHWPSDVLAGWCLGAMWALAGWVALKAMGARTPG